MRLICRLMSQVRFYLTRHLDDKQDAGSGKIVKLFTASKHNVTT